MENFTFNSGFIAINVTGVPLLILGMATLSQAQTIIEVEADLALKFNPKSTEAKTLHGKVEGIRKAKVTGVYDTERKPGKIDRYTKRTIHFKRITIKRATG